MNKSDIQLNERESLAIVCAAVGKPPPKVLQCIGVLDPTI